MRTTTIFAETHTSERVNHVAYRLVIIIIMSLYQIFYTVMYVVCEKSCCAYL